MPLSDHVYRLRLCRRLLQSIPKENELQVVVGLLEYTQILTLLERSLNQMEAEEDGY